MRLEARRSSLNAAKDELSAALEPLKAMRQKISGVDGLFATSCKEVRSTLDTAIHALSLVGARLKELEE